MNIAIWDYVIAVNGNGFGDKFFCSVYFLFCFLMNIAIWDYVIAVNCDGFLDNFFALYIFCWVF